MTIATCRSTVVLLPPTPLGLPSARRRVDHTCSLCRQPVLTDQPSSTPRVTAVFPTRPRSRRCMVRHTSMRAPRRDHYLPPITGDDTETVVEAAIESLATLRASPGPGMPPPGCTSLPASRLRPSAAFPEPSPTPVTSSARGPTSPTCSASPAPAPSSATAPAPPPTAGPSVRHEHPPSLDALPPAHGLVEDLAARCCRRAHRRGAPVHVRVQLCEDSTAGVDCNGAEGAGGAADAHARRSAMACSALGRLCKLPDPLIAWPPCHQPVRPSQCRSRAGLRREHRLDLPGNVPPRPREVSLVEAQDSSAGPARAGSRLTQPRPSAGMGPDA